MLDDGQLGPASQTLPRTPVLGVVGLPINAAIIEFRVHLASQPPARYGLGEGLESIRSVRERV
jgi:hypothetical protein